jgi:hypothetical protein
MAQSDHGHPVAPQERSASRIVLSARQSNERRHIMDLPVFPIVGVLIAITFGAVLIFAFRSKKETQKRLESDDRTKSTLARDKDSHGKPADT